ncbi:MULTISPECIES: fimbrillin family protein [Bacteroidales]|uniref:Fimbrillin family protein n=1 Tax=Marseilla massiliensis TaxID=1841864 RepID=A0A938WM97_9BACT|nr:fimbrillin family protein [Marseilla massiliensis]MBM6718608.1 fimbrillin family protein [Bacteroides gallinaceum]
MRHALYLIPAAAVLLFAATACTRDDLGGGTLPEGEYPLVIRATGLQAVATPASTRATVDGDWQGIQTVALSVGGTVKQYNVTASDADGYRSATLSSDTDPFWWTSREDITVSAWWPYGTTMPDVVVKADQSTREGFEGSDFISAEAQAVQFDNPTLKFSHRTARITVLLKPGDGITSVTGADVYVTGLSTDNNNPATIETYAVGGNSYEALTAPQTVAKGEPFIRVELGGGNFYFRPQNDVVLEAGNRYKYTVNVNATGLTLEGCTIGDWADGGGESGAAEDLGYNYDTNTKTYTVYNADGLLAWNEAAQKDQSINCTLSADINMAGKEWTRIGTDENNSYNGTFDGNGKTITGLTVNQSEKNYAGLFGCLGSDGKVQNLTLENVHISGVFYVGSVVGTNFGTVSGCTASGNITGTESCIGGVVGQNKGTVTGCTVSGNISSNQYTGGVVGENFGTVSACYHATGDVTGNINYVGGVVGWNYYGTVTACYHVNGNVTATYNWVGSVAGFNGGVGSVTACYWNDSPDPGIGYDNGSGQATKVDGTDVTWQTAVAAMNTALQSAGSEWRYKLTGELPTLKKEE